jgi:hypothetical protein
VLRHVGRGYLFALFGEPVGGGGEFFVAVYEAVLLEVGDDGRGHVFGFAVEGVKLEQFAAVEVAVGLEEMTGRHGLEDVFVGRLHGERLEISDWRLEVALQPNLQSPISNLRGERTLGVCAGRFLGGFLG